ncbi:hypothetical protein ANSO36C_62070 [Nostoc cf. commune SO-36]|uniref:WD40 repeat-containing protein n=1 Tax=Nostoc cf. commune SO-36 TaxID=449208 RepID=A0ABM7ZAX7_NOSCO|nr:WD40 repeat domain-containing protein [Nostoc commune]BDI20405.1 hypothetical protein ANSO36C_62070 [Nostoc cf. commune SO-36]
MSFTRDRCFEAIIKFKSKSHLKLKEFMLETNSKLLEIIHDLIKDIVEQNPKAIYYIQEMIYEGKYGRRLQGFDGNVPAHDDNVNDVKVSLDGKMIASASVDKTVKVWRKQEDDTFLSTSWKMIDSLDIQHQSPVWSVTFSRNGELIASGDADGIIKITSINNNSINRQIKPKEDNDEIVLKLMFSPDDQSIVSANWDKNVRVWKLLDHNYELIKIGEHDDKVYGVCFNSDGKFIASGGGDNKVNIWSLPPDAKLLHSLVPELEKKMAQKTPVFDVKFSFDGQMIAAAYKDNFVRIWDIKTKKTIKNCKHKDTVYGISFSPDNQMIASGSKDGFVRVWSTVTYGDLNAEPIAEFWHGVQINSVSFSHDGKFIASGGDDKNVRIWDTVNIGESRQELIERISKDTYNYLINIVNQPAIFDILQNLLSIDKTKAREINIGDFLKNVFLTPGN